MVTWISQPENLPFFFNSYFIVDLHLIPLLYLILFTMPMILKNLAFLTGMDSFTAKTDCIFMLLVP